ncbi:MAG: hypothetical protein IK094_08655 [Treponema sp.]|nr:hypothetical protein [Treponema sp.]
MNFFAIKLNPSQELKLAKAANDFLGPGGPLLPGSQKGLVRQPVEQGKPIFLRPLLCVMPDDFNKEEFSSIEKFEIFLPRKKNPEQEKPLCFWAKIWTRPGSQANERFLVAPIPFAIPFSMAKDFSLEKVFETAKDLARDSRSPEEECQEEPFYSPSSFKLCETEASKNEWKLYDLAWKKL